MNLSFAGCGFLGIYHIGVACCFRKYAPHLLLNKISGASAGAMAACCILCELPLGEITSDILRVSMEARRKSLGPFAPSFNIHQLLLEGLQNFLPDNAHLLVSGKLHVSLTRVCDGKNVIVSHFETREELIQCLLASSFIPFFSGIIPPKYRGYRYMDGGYSDNLPTIDENTITVSPFCGESDICPRDDSSQLFHINIANTSIELSKHNIYRMMRILFPPKTEALSSICKQGFDDGLRFLHKNNLINCTRCLAVQSTFVVSDDNLEYDPQCKECKIHRQEALMSNMPDTVLNVFQEVIDSANKGILNWVFKHRGMKLLSALSLPYTLPADILYATFTRSKLKLTPLRICRKITDCSIVNIIGSNIETQSLSTNLMYSRVDPDLRLMAALPTVGNSFWELSKYFLEKLLHMLNKVNKKQQISAKIVCQLAVTEYGGNDIEACQSELSTANKLNLNFTLNIDDSDLPLIQSPERKFTASKIIQRTPSLTFINSHTGDEDAFEHILQVTSHHETIMAYYYLDDDNKLKVTEIFDVSESDSPIVQTTHEKEANGNLEFDDDWEETDWNTNCVMKEDTMYVDYLSVRRNSLAEMSENSSEDILDKDASNLFSDPESEWKVTENNTDEDDVINRPESDQTENCCNYKNYTPTFVYQEEI